MSRVLPMLFRLILVLAGLCVGVDAQVGKEGSAVPGRTQPPSKQQEIAEAADEGGDGSVAADKEGRGQAWENLTPEERLERGTRRGASNYCRFVASARPSRLMPGQSGTLFVTAVLVGSAVLPAPAPLQVTSPATQGSVTLGAATFQPAKAGTLAAGYLGRPVYDNTATFEIPITMAADAVIGKKQAVHVDVKFDLFDGASAQIVGRFIDRASLEIEVGLTSDPSVAMSASSVQARAASPQAVRGASGVEGARATARPEALGGEEVSTGVGASQSPAPVGGQAEPAMIGEVPGGGMPQFLIGGGVLVLAILALFLLRK